MKPLLGRTLITLIACLPFVALGEGTVDDCTEASFRAALAGGGEVTFTEDCEIELTSPVDIGADTTIDASDVEVVIRGNGSIRLFSVADNVALNLAHLTLIGGRGTNGGAIFINS